MSFRNESCWVFDIETTAIEDFRTLAGLTRIHCIGVNNAGGTAPRLYGPDEIEEGLKFLADQDVIAGHNIVGFDIPAIQKLYPDWKPGGIVRDTQILGRMAHPDRKNEDWAVPEELAIPVQLRGRHSLEAWGHRLKCHKDDYGKTTDWGEYTPEMGEYCMQDVEVTRRLFNYLWDLDLEMDQEAVEVEHDFASILNHQMKHGFAFDVDAATALYAKLVKRKDELESELQDIFPPAVVKMKTPQYYLHPGGSDGSEDETYFRKKDCPARWRGELIPGPMKEKSTPFNPGSRTQIAQAFKDKYGWEPTEFTGDGRAKVDETILGGLDFPEAKPLGEYLMVTKRIGQLAEGNEAYIKLEKNGRIHGNINHYGTVTGRCTHSRPNVSQCVSVRAPYGKEFRELFTVPDGYSLVGCDASQLELRCLAHYMNDPEYVKEIIEGDVHSKNQAAAGLPTRDLAKTFAYAVCYGAGATRLGMICGATPKEGARLKARFLKNLPALKLLIQRAQAAAAERGYLLGLMKQRLPVRSPHRALNTLLQGAGATVMKCATVRMHKAFMREKLTYNDVRQVAHIHDEVQFQVRTEVAELVGQLLKQSIQETTDYLSLRCPMDGDYRIGRTWAETH